MNAFKKKSLCLAIAAGLGAVGMAGTASAVNINSNGLGSALIYPYFTTRVDGTNQYNTYISVVNTRNEFKAVKVRVLEGRNSREVLDFNLYLSPFDVWTAALTPAKTINGVAPVPGQALGGRLVTNDRSCTQPMASSNVVAGEDGIGWNFSNVAFTGPVVAGPQTGAYGLDGVTGSDSLDRSREGYVEIIEMGVVTSAALQSAIRHNAQGFPSNCLLLQLPLYTGQDGNGGQRPGSPNPVAPPTGGLSGTGTLIQPQNGFTAGYDAVALASFSNLNIWTDPGNPLPNLTQVSPATSVVFKGGAAITSNWTAGTADAVSAVLMHDSLVNEIVLDSGSQSNTDWVITMPTKRHYVPVQPTTGTVFPVVPPFTSKFWITGTSPAWTGGACENVTQTWWDREEQTPTSPPPTLVPSPQPITAAPQPNALCWETTVINFIKPSITPANTSVLQSSNLLTLQTAFQTFDAGWMKLSFTQPGQAMTSLGATASTYIGLPVLGLKVNTFINRNVAGSRYGVGHAHVYTTNISGAGVPVGVSAIAD